MKLMDKIKNALFEEEYVEIEEKPKRQKAKKQNKKIEPFEDLDNVREEPIAKRIVPPERKVEVEKPKDISVVDVEKEVISKPIITSYDTPSIVPSKPSREERVFPMVSDDDLKPDNVIKSSKNVNNNIDNNSTYNDISIKEKDAKVSTSKPYQASKKADGYLDNYTVHEYGSKTKEKTYFKPSPIISPIYGIIEEKDKKEEYRPPKEVRLSSSFHDKVNVDDVRKKAFGGLADDIRDFSENIDSSVKPDISNDDNLLVDLRDDDSVVEVDKLTVGDAVEYFEDLGLEYNNDYIDVSKEKASGRRVKTDQEYEKMPTNESELSSSDIDDDKPSFLKQKEVVNADKSDEENLFDLIDSMYDK